MRKHPTSKQKAFADAVIAGVNPGEAYKAVYSCTRMNAHNISTEAGRLLKNPVVAPLVREGRRKATEHAQWTRERSIKGLMEVYNDAIERLRASKGKTAYIPQDVLKGILESNDRLNKMCGVDETTASEDKPVIVDDIGGADED
ncbi:MAG: hypothetical protein LKF61_00890 [Eggerthellaceae bacterium]|jgi:phage terminase small subunit|nr:hypothetical protein [Eggerthellaceae bacterium]MCH4220475.1 hypothetical protein [Eggerthellaceae bacterium]